MKDELIWRSDTIKAIEERHKALMNDEPYKKKSGDIDLLGMIPVIKAIPTARSKTRDFTLREDDYGIRYLLNAYCYDLNKLNPLEETDWHRYNLERERTIKLYEQAFKVLATSEACRCGELYIAEDFRESQACKSFIPYDGCGVYLDWDGNKLGSINWTEPFSAPEKAVFVAWYNK